MARKATATTLTQIKEMMNDSAIERILKEEYLKLASDEKIDNICVEFPIMDNGQKKFINKCKKCGHIYITDSYSYEEKCPSCETTNIVLTYGKSVQIAYVDNKFIAQRNMYNGNGNPLIVKKINDVFVISSMIPMLKQTTNSAMVRYVENDTNEWMLDGISLDASVHHMMFFTEKHGGRVASGSTYGIRSLLSLTDNNDWYIGMYFKDKIIVNDDLKELAEIIKMKHPNYKICDAMKLFNKNMLEEKSKSKTPTKKQKDPNDLVGEIPTDELLVACMEKYSGENPMGTIAVNGNKVTYAAMCLCENIISGEEMLQTVADEYTKIQISEICPCCGRRISGTIRTYNPNSQIMIKVVYWDKINDDCVVRREFQVIYDFDISSLKCNIKKPKEISRIFFNKKKIEAYSSDLSGEEIVWKKQRIDYVCDYYYYYSRKETMVANTPEQLTELINGTFLKTTGLMQAWGLGDYSDFKVETAGSCVKDGYLVQWYKKPYLELVVKSKLKAATKDLMNREINKELISKTNIYDILGVNKGAFKIARERDLSVEDIKLVAHLYEIQPNFSIELWDELSEQNVNIPKFIETCKKSSTSVRRLIDYIKSCYDNQCIVKSEALDIFSDYYRMAEKIGFNIQDKNIKFPSSLKKEHDKASFAYKVVEDDIKKQAFIENSTKNKKYEFENKKYAIIIPNTPDEVITEGQKQHHCVASYVSRIEKGDTCICFLRKKNDLDTPYYTCEVYDGKIYQVKGFSNRYPSINDEPELIEFIQKWGKAKNLKIEYMKH